VLCCKIWCVERENNFFYHTLPYSLWYNLTERDILTSPATTQYSLPVQIDHKYTFFLKRQRLQMGFRCEKWMFKWEAYVDEGFDNYIWRTHWKVNKGLIFQGSFKWPFNRWEEALTANCSSHLFHWLWLFLLYNSMMLYIT